MEHLKFIPWNSKYKFVILKQYLENENINSMIDSSDLIWAIFQGINQNNLVTHCTNVFRLCLQKNSSIVQYVSPQLEFVLLEPNLTVSQINIFKYIIPELIKSEEGIKVLQGIVERMEILAPEEISYFVLPKLLDTFCNKLGISMGNVKFDIILQNGLKHENNEIRLANIQHYINVELSVESIRAVEIFLIENSYIESAPFRNEFLKLYSNFMANLEKKLYRFIRDQPNDVESNQLELQIIEHFCWLSEFIENCLKNNSYQRNKIALQLLDLILRYFYAIDYTTEMKKQGLIRKNVEQKSLEIIKNYLLSKHKWNFRSAKIQQLLVQKILDESEDISESASKILIFYFNNSNVIDYKELYIKSMENMKTVSYFYDVESNIRSFEVAIRNSNDLLDNITKILDEFIDFIKVNFKELQKDITVIITSNELYSYLLVILRFKYHLNSVQLQIIHDLTDTLIHFWLNLFHIGKNDNEIPSFAEMAIALNKILKINDENETLLSDDEQMLLNRIWLNLKVCCELLTAIGSHNNGEIFQQQCVDLLATIALGNRHKGVIESAGTSVQELTKYLTSTGNSHVIDQKLQSILESISNESFRSSCTRRTAGLSIFIYRIILGDHRNDKPSLKFVIDNLTDLIEKAPNQNESMKVKNDELIDGPLVIALHCLRPLIHDSSLWVRTQNDLMKIIKICFINMAGEKEWSIRNAALQLYGALIPKLIGQNKDVSIEVIHNSHPSLLQYLLNVLKSNYGLRLQILQFLSQTFVTTCQIDKSDQMWNLINEIKSEIFNYLDDQQFYVRNLAAKTYSQFTSIKYLIESINQLLDTLKSLPSKNIGTNHLHGIILAISYLLNRLLIDGNNIISSELTTKIKNDIFQSVINLKQIPNFMWLPLVKFYVLDDSNIDNFGLHEKKHIELVHITNDKFEHFIHTKLDQYLIHPTDIESFLTFLSEKITNKSYVRNNTTIFQLIVEKILAHFFTENSHNIKLLMINSIVNILIANPEININQFKCEIISNNFFVNSFLIFSLPFACCFFPSFNGNHEKFFSLILSKLNQEYLSFTNLEESIEKRLEIGDCLLLLLRFNECKYLMNHFIFIAYQLLIDDEEIVRKKASEFILELSKELNIANAIKQHSYSSLIGLIEILLPQILNPFEQSKFLINSLFYVQNSEQNCSVNPFAHSMIVNKNEDYYLLNLMYEKLDVLLKSFDLSDFEEIKTYFLIKYKNDSILLEKQTLKLEFIKKVENIFLS